MSDVRDLVEAAARAAAEAAPGLAAAGDDALDGTLLALSDALEDESDAILAANAEDVEAGTGSLNEATLDRLRLDPAKLHAIAEQVRALTELPPIERVAGRRERPDGLVLEERRIPVGVVGANYEARANVTVDIASQFVKSRNAGVLRTGAAALGTAAAMVDRAVGPALASAGLPADAIQLVRTPDRDAAYALVSLPGLVPLVILRGSGETTAKLALAAAQNGVRTLAHAEGGGVMYVHPSAGRERVLELVTGSLDRLGVCNRLNLLLVDRGAWDDVVPAVEERLRELDVEPSLPPHRHPIGHEWATDDAHAATVTIAPADGPDDAAAIANAETSGLAATVVSEDADAARRFLDAYRGTGGFWNVSTRLLDGFKLFEAPETGINVDRVPGPRGPVTYRDLSLKQLVVTPATDAAPRQPRGRRDDRVAPSGHPA